LYWPKKSNQPFGITSEYSWSEIGAMYKIIADYKVGLFIETGVNQGDLAAWMLARGFFIPEFHYVGITNDISILDKKLEDLMRYAEQSFVAAGVCWSDAILSKVKRLIKNSRSPVMVFCDGRDVEREFTCYFDLLRSGDVLASYKFPVGFRLPVFKKLEDNEKVKRINGDFMKNTAIIAGVLM
jgi:hypothetical protein